MEERERNRASSDDGESIRDRGIVSIIHLHIVSVILKIDMPRLFGQWLL